MLELTGVTVAYGSTVAVSGVDLTVPDGTVLALLGPSGCGKSTLLRAIAGLEPVAAGAIRWDGTDLTGVPVHHRGFGLMFQDGVLFPHRDVAGNIAYGLRRAGMSRAESAARVDDLLDIVGLPGFGPRRVGTLSGGEAQRVALARALAPRPRLLLLDEPLAALDTSLRERLLADLKTVLTATGTTAVFVTHDQSEAFTVADHLAVMRAGTVRQAGPPREIWSHPADDWVAGFVGYTSVLDASAADLLLTRSAPDGKRAAGPARLALRPSALVMDPNGPIAGQVAFTAASPEGLHLTVAIDGIGPVRAIAPADAAIGAGAAVRLRLDTAGTATLPAAAEQMPIAVPATTAQATAGH
jgi:thiamine transport system ATP-binding protein